MIVVCRRFWRGKREANHPLDARSSSRSPFLAGLVDTRDTPLLILTLELQTFAPNATL